ncbi:MAG: hypothetical protein LBK00_01390 [Treponema sp.]|nr:hypothetical protein [Treponema sp.]
MNSFVGHPAAMLSGKAAFIYAHCYRHSTGCRAHLPESTSLSWRVSLSNSRGSASSTTVATKVLHS